MSDDQFVEHYLQNPDEFEKLRTLVARECRYHGGCVDSRAIRRLFSAMYARLGGDTDEPDEIHTPPINYPKRTPKPRPAPSVAHLDWMLEDER